MMFCSCLYDDRLIYLGLQDGTWDTIKGCFTVIRDFGDFCYHSYKSFMQDLRERPPTNGEHYEIRFFVLFCFVFCVVLFCFVCLFVCFGLFIWLLYHLSHLE